MAAPECDRFGEDLSAYLDGELPQQRTAELEQHLLGCDSCRGTFEQLRNVAERLAELPHVRAPDELTAAMRRAAERQVLLDVRTPRAKTRVWKLFARVSASAALIAACMFAGWQVYERMQEPSVPSTERRLGRGMRSLDVARAEPAEQPILAAKPAEPALAFADKTKEIEAGVSTEAYVGVSARDHLVAVETEFQAGLTDVPVAATTTATIDVFVTPQDPQQATAVRGTLAAWLEPVSVELDTGKRGSLGRYAGGAPATGAPIARAGRAGVAETVDRREFAFELTAAEANDLIDQLEQQAPRQVLLRYADVQRVQQAAERDDLDRLAERGLADELGRPAAAPPADAEEEGQPGRLGRFGAGAEARRAAMPRKLTPRSFVGKQEEMEARRGHGRGGEPPAPAKAAKKDEKAATAQRGVAARRRAQPTLRGGRMGGAGGEDKGQHAGEPAAESVAPPASQPADRREEPATPPAQAEQLRAAVVKVRDQLGEFLFGAFMRAAAEPAPPSESPPPRPVTVRVMLLPPPQPQATQPATPPGPQP